jgi:hypothetical protein
MLYRVYNQGEITPLAHGWRCVIALTPGRKWLTVIDWTTLETARLEIAEWDSLKPLPTPAISSRKVRAVMRRRLPYVTATQPIKDALSLLRERRR